MLDYLNKNIETLPLKKKKNEIIISVITGKLIAESQNYGVRNFFCLTKPLEFYVGLKIRNIFLSYKV